MNDTPLRDPIQETIERLRHEPGGDIPARLIAAAWRERLYPELDRRVGVRLVADLDDRRLDDFSSLIDADDDAETGAWLADNVPHYPRIVAEELDRMIADAVRWFARAAAGAER